MAVTQLSNGLQFFYLPWVSDCYLVWLILSGSRLDKPYYRKVTDFTYKTNIADNPIIGWSYTV